ncbi:MAG: GIY-YIG nuclease family protein, partial [Candidatus Polarisedimenticolia bacterium]
RRLEPMDRVRELGDASVPFQFDVHAMMYSDDAPTLEKDLHRQFADRSVNLVNMRKEFFAVSLDEVEAFAKTKGVTVEFTQSAEAREFRETCSIRRERALATAETERGSAPDEFAALLAEASASGGAHA